MVACSSHWKPKKCNRYLQPLPTQYLLSGSMGPSMDNCVVKQVIIMQKIVHCILEGQLWRSREWKSLLRREECLLCCCVQEGKRTPPLTKMLRLLLEPQSQLLWHVGKSKRMCIPWELCFYILSVLRPLYMTFISCSSSWTKIFPVLLPHPIPNTNNKIPKSIPSRGKKVAPLYAFSLFPKHP